MKRPGRLVIGTRGSQMALVQAQQVADALVAQNRGLTIETCIISTRGDRDDSPIPLDTIGKAWFTSEIERALHNGEIDIAVHSLKDVPPNISEELLILPVLLRDEPRDALVTRANVNLARLQRGAVVGTDSLRRKAQVLRLRPDLVVESVRGNANTRLEKMAKGHYDALIMAAAGLQRIDKANLISELFRPEVFVPAPGQGALAAEIRAKDVDILTLLKQIQDPTTVASVSVEQSFMRTIGGGCKLPIGCYADIDERTVYIYGMVGSLDATRSTIKTLSGLVDNADELARQLATELAAESFVAEYTDATAK